MWLGLLLERSHDLVVLTLPAHPTSPKPNPPFVDYTDAVRLTRANTEPFRKTPKSEMRHNMRYSFLADVSAQAPTEAKPSQLSYLKRTIVHTIDFHDNGRAGEQETSLATLQCTTYALYCYYAEAS